MKGFVELFHIGVCRISVVIIEDIPEEDKQVPAENFLMPLIPIECPGLICFNVLDGRFDVR